MRPNQKQKDFLQEVIDELQSLQNTNDITSPSNPNISEIQRIIDEYFDDLDDVDEEIEKQLEVAIKNILILTRKLNEENKIY